MHPMPQYIKISYAKAMAANAIPAHSQNSYFKWLGFYFDFCKTYHHDIDHPDSVQPFILKLREKNQSLRVSKRNKKPLDFDRNDENPSPS